MTILDAFEQALQRHRAGRLAEAGKLYLQILATQPNHADAMHLLGVVAHQMGRHEDALKCIRQAIDIDPNNPFAHSNLGETCRAAGRPEEAIAAYRRALQIRPAFPEAHNNLGNVLRDQNQLDEAIAEYRRALQLRDDFPEAHHNLGAALRERGQLTEAIAVCRRALRLTPLDPYAHNNLASALKGARQPDEAISAYRRALQLKPDSPEIRNNLGSALKDQGKLDDAIAAYLGALQLKPQYPEAFNNLGNALRDRGQLDEAIAAYRRALELKPEHAWVHSNLIFALHIHPDRDVRTIVEEHQHWGRRFEDPLKQATQPHTNDRNHARRLRVGYVSPDFLHHAVSLFALPLFECHNRDRFDIFCYSGVAEPSPTTERFRALAAGWRNTLGVSDAQLAGMIREDRVDILVDLAMRTAGNRLLAFARRPAPVQVAWLAYPGSTGLRTIGYRLTDSHMDPPGDKPVWSTEEPVRLPNSWCCYQPGGESPAINSLPALSAESLTFGSLNDFSKVNEVVLALWARVLEAVKRSRLVLLCPEGQARERVHAFFGARGIGAERVELVGRMSWRDYLRRYHRIDVGLDPFPCNGMTTTCDALWMGVPVLTLPGDMPISRAGLSLLSTVGLGELAASSEEDYVRIAVELARDLPRLAELRATLRARMQASPLMDAPRFARNVEAAYREMWERWCVSSG